MQKRGECDEDWLVDVVGLMKDGSPSSLCRTFVARQCLKRDGKRAVAEVLWTKDTSTRSLKSRRTDHPFSTTTIMQSSFDRRRVNGPEDSYIPEYESDEEPESSSMAARRNGRSAKDTRPICASFFIVHFL